jgi:hypothetical protein
LFGQGDLTGSARMGGGVEDQQLLAVEAAAQLGLACADAALGPSMDTDRDRPSRPAVEGVDQVVERGSIGLRARKSFRFAAEI